MIPTTDNQQFKPYSPEPVVVCTITKREAVLISKLRRHLYGKFIVHKVNGIIMRLEINDSQLIDDQTEINLD